MSKKLVAFFSASGSTRKLSQTLAEAIGADIYEIKPAVKYTGRDLNWNDQNSRSSVEMADKTSRPTLAETADVSAYDTIFLGFPIWWYVAPHIVNSFLESGDFSGKLRLRQHARRTQTERAERREMDCRKCFPQSDER